MWTQEQRVALCTLMNCGGPANSMQRIASWPFVYRVTDELLADAGRWHGVLAADAKWCHINRECVQSYTPWEWIRRDLWLTLTVHEQIRGSQWLDKIKRNTGLESVQIKLLNKYTNLNVMLRVTHCIWDDESHHNIEWIMLFISNVDGVGRE